MSKGGLVTLVLAAGAAAAVHPDHLNAEAVCRSDLEAKRDAAVGSCLQAYAAHPSVLTAKQVVNAYTPRGDAALASLLALHPIDPIGAEIWHKRGGRLRDAGNTDDAILVYQHALALRGGDLEGRVRELAALSERYNVRGDVSASLAIQARAYETAVQLGDPLTLSHVQIALSIELGLVGDEQGAERAMADSVDHLPPDDPYLPPALINIATNHLYHGRPELARTVFERVLTLSDRIAAGDAHQNLIGVALLEGKLDEARRLIASDPSSEHAAHQMYVARLAFAEHRYDDALDATQRAARMPGLAPRAQYPIETLQGEVLASQGRDAEAIPLLTRAIDGYEKELDRLGIDELKAWAQRAAEQRAPYEHLFAIYARSGDALRAFAIAQRASSRAYLDGLVAPQTSNQDIAALTRAAGVRAEALHVIAKSLRSSAASRAPEPEELLKLLADETIWTFFAADGEVWLAALDHGVATVDDLGPLAAMSSVIDAASRLDDAALARLDRMLVPRARWDRAKRDAVIHVVAGTPFEQVPFGALGTGQDRWVERAAFAHVSSAGVLGELSRRNSAGVGVHVLGDPLGDLAGARDEAITTAARFHATAHLGEQARRSEVFAAAHAELLAISSHAEAVSGGAQLRLADGPLTAADVIDHHVAPRLVVLASCSSAAAGVDAWGALAGAFLAAGTPNVIATKWALDDTRRDGLLTEFYAADGLHHPALALALAQGAAIAHHVPVYAWASLIAMGTGENSYQPRGNR